MAQKTINIGTGELTGDGESIRSAFSKANDNFTELYSNTTNVETSVDLHLNTAGATNNQILSWDGSDYVWRADNSGIALTDFVVGPETPTPAGNGEILYNNTNGMFQYTPPVLNGLTATGDTDFGSNKITYANVYATEGDLPDATVYHGMFAHVHATGAGYFAHAGLWTKLANDSQLSSYQTTAGLNSAIDTHLNQSGPTSGYVLSWDGSDYAWVENTGGGGGGANVSVSDNPPAGTPTQGDLWWESDVGKLKIYYGSAWVDANPTGAGGSGGAATIQGLSDVNAGDTIADGDFMLYDISNNHFAFANFESEVHGKINAHLNQSSATSSQILSWNGSDYAWVNQSGGGLANVVDDTSPELGGDLNVGGNSIVGGNAPINLAPGGTASINLSADETITTGKILYSNVYSQLADLPSASTYHGMFAHVHATGAGYFAHAGNWIQLANYTDLSAYQTTGGLSTNIDLHLNQGSAGNNQVLSWDGADYAWVNQSGGGGGLTNVVDTSNGAIVNGVLELAEGVNEQLSILTGATGVVAHDCSNGYIFRHTTPAADFTANLTNFYCNTNCVTSVSLMIIQGASAYIPTALQIGGAGQTINWQGGSTPAGNPNKTDVFTFTITNLGASYDVIAQLVDFG